MPDLILLIVSRFVTCEVWGLTLSLLYSDNLTCPHKVKSSRLYDKSHGSNKLLTVGIPFRIESYIFSPVPWKGNEPLRRMNSITPKREHHISLHHITVVVYNTLEKECIISAIICLTGTCIYINSTGNLIFLPGVFKDQPTFGHNFSQTEPPTMSWHEIVHAHGYGNYLCMHIYVHTAACYLVCGMEV